MYKKKKLLLSSLMLSLGVLVHAVGNTATAGEVVPAAMPSSADTIEGCPSPVILQNFGEFAKTGKMPPAFGKWLNSVEAQRIEPYQLFDNVYNVGICWVNAWIIKTSDGPVLIDTTYGPFFDLLISNMKKVGVEPADLKLVLMTHGHFDHVGGADRLKALTKAPFVMTQTGWDEALEHSKKIPFMEEMKAVPDEHDIVAKDGDIFTVGDTEFRVYETPGHTWGTASYVYNVKDGDREVRAITIGGLGLNGVNDTKQLESYIASVNRIDAMVESTDNPIQVHIPTHSFASGLTEQVESIQNRKPGEPHPLLKEGSLVEQLEGLRSRAEQRLSTLKQ